MPKKGSNDRSLDDPSSPHSLGPPGMPGPLVAAQYIREANPHGRRQLGSLPSDALLSRFVVLNHERAAEESAAE